MNKLSAVSYQLAATTTDYTARVAVNSTASGETLGTLQHGAGGPDFVRKGTPTSLASRNWHVRRRQMTGVGKVEFAITPEVRTLAARGSNEKKIS
jgi:hypothetical protein